MIEVIERGLIVARDDGHVDVRMIPAGDCDSCGMCSGAGGQRVLEHVRDEHGAEPGDHVEIITDPVTQRRAILLLYVVPVVAVLIGYLAGSLLGQGIGLDADVAGAATGIVLGVAAMLSIRWLGGHMNGDEEGPRVRAIIARGRDGLEDEPY